MIMAVHVVPTHTFGSKCRLAKVDPLWSQKDVPETVPQYFYSSPISIDDPLSSSLIANSADSKNLRGPLRPFSPGDNNALERAWLSIANDNDRECHRRAQLAIGPLGQANLPSADSESLSRLVGVLISKHSMIHDKSSRPNTPLLKNDTPLSTCCPELIKDVQSELERAFCPLARSQYRQLQRENVIQEIMNGVKSLTRDNISSLAFSHSYAVSLPSEGDALGGVGSHGSQKIIGRGKHSTDSAIGSPVSPSPALFAVPIRPPGKDDGVTGRPFARMVPSSVESPQHSASSSIRQADSLETREKHQSQQDLRVSENFEKKGQNINPMPTSVQKHAEYHIGPKALDKAEPDGRSAPIEVPVGVSRLHMVSLPQLEMKPIYWSPVNDIAVVLRATWFYSETMVPVDPVVANQLEAGFQELRPYSETWKDELRCAIEVGPLGEEKVVHKLWPKPLVKGGSNDEAEIEPIISRNQACAARCYRGEASTEGYLQGIDMKESVPSRPFSNYHVIYRDRKSAFLLKPSLRPSAYYNRRPVSRICKGHAVGIPIQRGFDLEVWNKAQNKKESSQPFNQSASAATANQDSTGSSVCPACKLDKEKGQVTDLVLVAHGIGQKFAERVESFHFTHAINAFRREINIELESSAVQSVLRKGQNGIMVLPVNWRHTLSFEDGGPMTEADKAAYMPEGFSLKDIEPTTIPAVRSMISDVMFDIPFYMSQHKHKMIAALVTEANRVYRLWCRNNPGFAEHGKVHIIGHSLGSAMAIDVLSRQPNHVPRLDPQSPAPSDSQFEFDTTNLFLLGSPAGFFLLLERGALMPRRGRNKPGVDTLDVNSPNITAEPGIFGCLAVNNVYNILAREDPIAYLLNGTIDPAYAAGLKVAYIPSISSSIFKSMGDAMRTLVPGLPPATTSQAAAAKPPTARLPSQLELEVHDFTREEIAEKKAFLLNDNGQIDYYIRSGGGPLEIQYLNMLSAHTTYWTSRDLIRMLCMEIGREPGKENTLPSLRAVKISKGIASSLAVQ